MARTVACTIVWQILLVIFATGTTNYVSAQTVTVVSGTDNAGTTITKTEGSGDIVVKNDLKELQVASGETIALTCTVDGDEWEASSLWFAPLIGISFNENLLHPDSSKFSLTVQRTADNTATEYTVRIHDVRSEDEGVYRCQGIQGLTDEVNIVVIPIPNSAPGSVTVEILDAENIRVAWDDIPLVSSNGPILGYRVYYTKGMSTEFINYECVSSPCVVSGLTPFSDYSLQVAGYNGDGEGPKSLPTEFSSPQRPPNSAPSSVEVEVLDANNVRVSWDDIPLESSNGPILGYRVYCSKLLGFEITNQTIHECRSSPCVVSGLVRNSKYSLQIAGYNAAGEGPKSYREFRSQQTPPNSAPTSVQVNILDAESIIVFWSDIPLDSSNGPILGYRVYYIRESTNQFMYECRTSPCVVSGLTPYSNYSLQIAGYNRAGEGPKSAPTEFSSPQGRPNSAPSSVQVELLDAESIRVSWGDIPFQSSNGPIIGYKVYYSKVAIANRTIHECGSSPCVVSGLAPYSYYSLQITGYNAAGEGPKSVPTEFRSPQERPNSAPSSVQVEILDTESIRVSWDDIPDESSNGPIVGYKVYIRGSTNRYTHVCGSSPCVVSGLTPNSDYSLHIAGFNAAGVGPGSVPTDFSSPQGRPNSAPSGVKVGILDSESIRVSWDDIPDESSNGPIVGYKVYIRGSTNRYTHVCGSSPCVVSGLTPNSDYSLHIAGFNAAGVGPGSVHTEFSSPQGHVEPTDDTHQKNCSARPRRYDITDMGIGCFFRGWADVQGQGSSNDYCRVVGLSSGKQQYFSCALAGTAGESEYNFNSPNASDVWFDVGYGDTWYMKDEDGDGKDDYCRCVGTSPDTYVSCMKSGEAGFISHYDFTPSDTTTNCGFIKVNPFLGPP